MNNPGLPTKPASRVTVPDGVGMNHQAAQDAWRAGGLIVAPADDATGANRVPVLDSNWIVLEQDLKPGSTVAVSSTITATVKKYIRQVRARRVDPSGTAGPTTVDNADAA